MLTGLGAVELAAKIAARELSSLEVVEAHIRRIEVVNPSLKAVVLERFEPALEEARAADAAQARGVPSGPLHGVPITLKELLHLGGTPSTAGGIAALDEPEQLGDVGLADTVPKARTMLSRAVPCARRSA